MLKQNPLQTLLQSGDEELDRNPSETKTEGSPDPKGIIRNFLLVNSMKQDSAKPSTTDVAGKRNTGGTPGDRSELLKGENRTLSPVNAIAEQMIVPFGDGTLNQGPGGMVGESEDRNDAFGMYLGFGQENDTFRESRHRPSDVDEEKRYVEYQNKENLDLLDEHARDFIQSEEEERTLKEVRQGAGPDFSGRYKEGSDRARFLSGAGPEGIRIGTMNKTTLRKGEDERGRYVSYRDTWDIAEKNNPYEREQGSNEVGMGTPFEIYGRRYYDPETGEILDEQPTGATTRQNDQGATEIITQ